MRKEYRIEICANSVESCIEAERGGAYRVELCAGIPEGGTTPSYGEIELARENIGIKLHVIIRPRGGDFLYTEHEHKVMLRDIEAVRKLGIDGVVIGTLMANGDIDLQRNRELIAAAEGLSITFHRAFDMCRDPYVALEQLIDLGCERVLSSGQQIAADKGLSLLKELVMLSRNRITIMPGCGVNEDNIVSIASQTGACEFHLSARSTHPSEMQFRNSNVSMGGVSVQVNEFSREITSRERVHAVLSALEKL